MSLHFHPLRVARVTPDTDEAVVIDFEVPPDLREAFAFEPGQYLTLRHDIDGEDLRRSYSICAGLDDGRLRVGVRAVPGGRFSTWLHRGLAAGDTLQVLPPQGRFRTVPQPERARHVLGIAAGSGITPILAIAKTVLAREPRSRVTLIYGNRTQRSTMFKEELEDLKNRHLTRLVLHHVFSQEDTDAPLASGRLDEAGLARFLGPLVDPAGIDEAFVCGPFGMNEAAEAALRTAGVPAERIHVERFGAPLADAREAQRHAPAPGDAPRATLSVVRDGLTSEVPYRDGHGSVLDAIAAMGLEAPYSCKSGVCATCRCKVTEGRVRMDRNFALSAEEVAAGFVLSCQAHPLTERVTVSFDER